MFSGVFVGMGRFVLHKTREFEERELPTDAALLHEEMPLLSNFTVNNH